VLVHAILPELRRALASGPAAVLQAPPGAGKTTGVPPALLGEPWLEGRKIVMLEPRRLAARAAARWMARQMGEGVGETVGYRVRQDTRVGPRTRIEVVTEGVLTRMLQSDPSLEGVGLLIFDEFHERSLQADLGLALTLQARELFRPDLRVLVMSATLDAGPVAALLGDAPVITSEGRAFPVETHYLEAPVTGRIEPAVAAAVRRALADSEGDVLAFLPGVSEIRRVEEMLADVPPGVDVRPLHGTLPPGAQDEAIAPAPPGRRKAVLATSIAETSLTIEGVRAVVDGGLVRRPVFDARTGLTRLETVQVSRASADQRRGRAGRLGPGLCYRLWTRFADGHLAARAVPEILEADLAPLVLELAVWGVEDPAALRWMDVPPPAAVREARDLLQRLGALRGGVATDTGRRMAEPGLHPRLAHMLVESGHRPVACLLAALLEERDIFRRRDEQGDADIRLRLDALADLAARRQPRLPAGTVLDEGAARRILEEARRLMPGRGDLTTPDSEEAGPTLALAYPDRVARRTAEGRFLLRNGMPAVLGGPQAIDAAPFIVVADLGGGRRPATVFLAAPIREANVRHLFAEDIEVVEEVDFDPASGSLTAVRQERLEAIVLREGPLRDPDSERVRRAVIEGVRAAGPGVLPWSKVASALRERLAFLHALEPEAWPDVGDAALMEGLDAWLGPFLATARPAEAFARLDLAEALLGLLPWERRAQLEALAPTHITVPSGSRVPVDYSDPAAPVLAVRLQEVFGLTDTPRVGGGRVPLTMHLLSPARRPMQVTRDLASFWREAYFDVRKDLRGRYPKHHWPEDPMEAEPTSRVKRRGR
jgi:ATP-dependent helicase HrpB